MLSTGITTDFSIGLTKSQQELEIHCGCAKFKNFDLADIFCDVWHICEIL